MSADPRVKIGVAAAVTSDDNIVLLRRAASASHGAGTVALPGGWVDYGEGLCQTAIREVREETGLYTINPRFLGWVANTYPDYDQHGMHVICAFIHLVPTKPVTVSNPEPNKHDSVWWADERELFRLRCGQGEGLFPPLRTFIDVYTAKALF